MVKDSQHSQTHSRINGYYVAAIMIAVLVMAVTVWIHWDVIAELLGLGTASTVVVSAAAREREPGAKTEPETETAKAALYEHPAMQPTADMPALVRELIQGLNRVLARFDGQLNAAAGNPRAVNGVVDQIEAAWQAEHARPLGAAINYARFNNVFEGLRRDVGQYDRRVAQRLERIDPGVTVFQREWRAEIVQGLRPADGVVYAQFRQGIGPNQPMMLQGPDLNPNAEQDVFFIQGDNGIMPAEAGGYLAIYRIQRMVPGLEVQALQQMLAMAAAREELHREIQEREFPERNEVGDDVVFAPAHHARAAIG